MEVGRALMIVSRPRLFISAPTFWACCMYAFIVIASWSQNGCHSPKHQLCVQGKKGKRVALANLLSPKSLGWLSNVSHWPELIMWPLLAARKFEKVNFSQSIWLAWTNHDSSLEYGLLSFWTKLKFWQQRRGEWLSKRCLVISWALCFVTESLSVLDLTHIHVGDSVYRPTNPLAHPFITIA